MTGNSIASLRDLQEDWDGHGAPRIDLATIDYAIELFARLAEPTMPKPSAIPTVGGGVQFEWHTATHHIELEVEGPEEFSLFAASRDLQQEPQYIDSNDVDEVRSELTRLFA